MLPLELLQILACPICTGELILIEQDTSLLCTACRTVYPVVEGIPILLRGQTGSAPPATGEAS